MDRDDFQTALGMVYDTFGWDHEKKAARRPPASTSTAWPT